MDLNLNVNVRFDATPTLVGCVNTLATALNGAPRQMVSPSSTPVSPVESVTVQVPAAAVEEAEVPKIETTAETASVQSKDITDEQLRALVGPKTKEFGKEKVFNILDEFGVKRVPDLNQEQRVAFVEKLNAL